MKLYPHQESGVDWLVERPVGMLGDEMGLGKTITALRAADRVGAMRILVLAPSVVTWNWKREAERWLLREGETAAVVPPGSKTIPSDARVLVISQDLFWRKQVYDLVMARSYDLLIVDEAHNYRNATAKRTKGLYGSLKARSKPGLAGCAKRVWLLTGTPAPNNLSEVWTHLRALAPERILNEEGKPYTRRRFEERYMLLKATGFGYKVVGNKDPEGLRQILTGFVLRRRKKDHLDLPPVRYETVSLGTGDVSAELRRLGEEGEDSVAELFELVGEDASFGEMMATLRASEAMSTFRRLCGLAKAPLAAELLGDELSQNEGSQIVVFAHHKAVLDTLAEKLDSYGIIRIDGSTPAQERTALVDKFQRGGARVALCNIVAGGVGVTLTAASELVFVEMSWIPGENSQAADRIHRIGQTADQVRVRALSLAGTIDDDISEALIRKVSGINEVLKPE